MKLKIELVPSTVWFSSLYKLLPRNIWDQIREEIIQKGGYKCHICGSLKPSMELHEIWKYNDKSHVQKLIGFQLLCRLCHHVKHIGKAAILASEGRLDYDEILRHFCKVNNCSPDDFARHKKEAFKIWEERSKSEWKQDFGKYQIYISKKTMHK